MSGDAYVFLAPHVLWLLGLVPLLWLPLWFPRGGRLNRTPALAAAVLRSVAALLLIAALAGLSRSGLLSTRGLTVVAAVDTSDSISTDARGWMRDYVERLRRALPAGADLAVLSFGTDSRLEVAPGPAADARLPAAFAAHGTRASDAASSPNGAGAAAADVVPMSEGGAAGTNIARALERAFALYPEGADKRLVLLSDGNETAGAARGAAATARGRGIAIYPVVPPGGHRAEVSLEKFVVPPLAREGGVFDLRLVVRNGHAEPVAGRAAIFADDRLLTGQAVSLAPGLSVLEVPARILERGNYLLRAELRTEPDPVAANNRATASLAVAGKTRALVVTDNPDTHLARALQLKDVEIEFRPPARLPTDLGRLLDYNSLVFDDVGRDALTAGQMDAVERYVRDFGGGFLLAGGARTFGSLDYRGSAIERVSPVAFRAQPPKRKKRIPIALFLLIDRSNSMGYNSRVRGLHDGQKMKYAQKAAAAVLDQLENSDFAGAIAFDSEAYSLAPLSRLSRNRATLKSRIGRLRYGGGTDFYHALAAAADQLTRSRRSIRHVILLTDGDTNRSPTDHYPLIKTIAQRQISVTTIRIGADTVNLQLLSYLSEKTGGRFYHVEDATKLPQLLVRDTRRTIRRQDADDEGTADVRPRVGARGEILRGLSDFPALDDYLLTEPKPRARVQLYADTDAGRAPLLATWQYGLGKVAAVPFDPSGAGAGEWIRWDRFGKFWSQAVRWVMRVETPREYRLRTVERHGRTVLRVESFDADERGVLQASLPRGGRTETLTLRPVAPRVYEAGLPARYTGHVPVTIVRRAGTKILNQRSHSVLVGRPVDAAVAEHRHQHPNRPLLHGLAERTGGTLDPALEELTAASRGGEKAALHPLDDALVLAALFLVLADMAVRVLFGPLRDP